MSEPPIIVFTPADVLRRVTAMGVIANAVTVWSFMRSRLEQHYPERSVSTGPTELPLDEETLAAWIDDFVDTVEVERSQLARNMNPLR